MSDSEDEPQSNFNNNNNNHYQQSSRHVSETEDAGLDFVDINLGPGESNGRSPYGLGGHAASRSAVEIRQDSISSNSAKARQIAQVAEARIGSTSMIRRSEEEEMHFDRQRDSSIDSKRSISTRRTAEGRYRGRLSQPNSRSPSPTPSPKRVSISDSIPPSFSIHDFGTPAPSSAGIVMSFAGDDGDIETVISPITEVNVPRVDIQEPDENSELQQEDIQAKDEGTPDANQGAAASQKADVQSEERAASIEEKDDEKAAASEGGIAANKEEITTSEEADANKSPVLTDAADKERKHRGGSSHKPSALEQHLSRTRMTTLPPKPKVEDTKHLHDFEEMMKLSKEMSLKKQQEEEEKKNKKDASLQERMKVWESEILPSWTRARRETRLRRLWWKGIPPNLRGRVWALACGNSQMLPRNLFNKSSAEAKEMRTAGTFPNEDLIAIEEDIEHTLPTLRLFQKETGPLYDDLFDLLCAFTIVRLEQKRTQASQTVTNGTNGTQADELDYAYPIGVASLAAMLLMNLSPSESLIALINLIADRPWLRALYSLSATANTRQSLTLPRGSVDGTLASPLSPTAAKAVATSGQKPSNSTAMLAGFERVFDTLLADQMPKVYANMQARGVRPSAYVNDWIRTLFVPFLPFDAVARLWDCILLEESDALLFRTGIALVSLLSARLYVPEKDELISILRGNNRAAISVWHRLRTGSVDLTASLSPSASQNSVNGTSINGANGSRDEEEVQASSQDQVALSPSVQAPEQFVPLDDIYGGQYGITETVLFRTLEEQDAWWKDSVLERLLDREIVS